MNIYSVPQPNDVIFFDVDGVLTDLQKNKVSDDLLLLLTNLIKNNFIVVLNSGRSMNWLMDEILEPLTKFSPQVKYLNLTNFFVVGEKGGVWLDFDKSSTLNPQILLDEKAQIPEKLILMVKNLVKLKFNKTMFFDLTKQTMLTLERKPTVSMENFQDAQKKIALELDNILSKLQLSTAVEIDITTIAIDIQSKILGKGYGVQKVINWLNQHKIVNNQFFTIGDSNSDFEMPKTLFQMGKPVLHVHVGEVPTLLKTEYPVLTTNRKYASGTKEFFKNLADKL